MALISSLHLKQTKIFHFSPLSDSFNCFLNISPVAARSHGVSVRAELVLLLVVHTNIPSQSR